MDNLAQKKCVPCEEWVPPLQKSQISSLKSQISEDWKISGEGTTGRGKKLQREFKFKDFAQAISFVNKVATIAEKEGHHPDISIHWNKVILTLWTHKIDGLHENDFILAAKIDKLDS